jgi:hypothetical protein
VKRFKDEGIACLIQIQETVHHAQEQDARRGREEGRRGEEGDGVRPGAARCDSQREPARSSMMMRGCRLRTCYNNMLARNDMDEAERRTREKRRSFGWGHPDELMRADLTEFNGMHILTIEDADSQGAGDTVGGREGRDCRGGDGATPSSRYSIHPQMWPLQNVRPIPVCHQRLTFNARAAAIRKRRR